MPHDPAATVSQPARLASRRATCSYRVLTADAAPDDTADFAGPLPDAVAAGQTVADRYRLDRELGRGGMGCVFLGRDLRLDRPVAIKFILAGAKGRPVGEAALADFAQEARIGANLTHPAVATVFDFGTHAGQPFTVFEYIGGDTLRALIDRRGKLPLDEVRLIVAPLAQALDFAHERRVVHRDLKPENIRATEQGAFKVLDLGLARDFQRQADWHFAGTPAYASPEQAGGLPCDGRTDQYALALIAYELLTGRWVFEADTALEMIERHRSAAPPWPGAAASELPEPVCAALLRALSKDPNGRYGSCEAFAVALGCAVLSAPQAAPEVLAVARLRALNPNWFDFTSGTRRGFLALTAAGLLTDKLGELHVWPHTALVGAKRRWASKRVRVGHRDGRGKERWQRFDFPSRREAREWVERLTGLVPTAPEPNATPAADPVTLLDRRPLQRFQLLGALEGRAGRLDLADFTLQVQAAMLGADAVVEVRREKLPGIGRTTWRCGGTAVRAVDLAGKRELRMTWFRDEVKRLAVWGGVLLLYALLYALLLATMTAVFLSQHSQLSEQPRMFIAGAGFVVVLLSQAVVPIAALAGLRFTMWPQLARPAALGVMYAGCGSMLCAAALSLAAVATGEWAAVETLGGGCLLNPVGLAAPVFAWLVARRLWLTIIRVERLPTDEVDSAPPARTIAGWVMLGLIISLAVADVLRVVVVQQVAAGAFRAATVEQNLTPPASR